MPPMRWASPAPSRRRDVGRAPTRPPGDGRRHVELYPSGRLKLDEMIPVRVPLEQVNVVFDAMRKGTAAPSVIVFD